MLSYVRGRVASAIASVDRCVLATDGPAGVLATECRCEASGLALYLLLPQTSDHLLNLEQNPRVAVATDALELTGRAHVLVRSEESRPELAIACLPGAEWHTLVRVNVIQLRIRRRDGWGSAETMDVPSADD